MPYGLCTVCVWCDDARICSVAVYEEAEEALTVCGQGPNNSQQSHTRRQAAPFRDHRWVLR